MSKDYRHFSDFLSEFYKDFPDEFSEKELKRLHTISQEFTAGFRMLMNQGPIVTVFGSSRAQEKSGYYELGLSIGSELAKEGFAVLTGGGPGCMEAVNRGAAEENGKSMGINILIPSEQKSNPYAIPSITLDHFFVRKVLLLKYSTAYIFLPGGFGTLDELFETVTLMQTGKVKPFPLVLMNRKFWSGLMDWVKEKPKMEELISNSDMNFFQYADTAKEALEIIRNGKLK